MQNLRANPNRKARGHRSSRRRLDKRPRPGGDGAGARTARCMCGDTIVAGTAYGRVRAMVNDRGERVKAGAARPMPVEVIGLSAMCPAAGDTI